MKLTKQSWFMRIACTLSLLLTSVAAFAARPNPNQNLITREQALDSGLSNLFAIWSAPANNGYLMLLGLSFLVGFGFFVFALIKYRKEKDKPEEQQEQTKYFAIMIIGMCLMGVTGLVLVFADTFGLGTGVGQGVDSEMQLDKNKAGYGVGKGGAADGFSGSKGSSGP